MSRNSSGSYTLPAGNPVVTLTTITSAWANTTLADVATELTNSLDRSGRGGMLAPLVLVSGSAGAPAITFPTETNTGLYRNGANDIRFDVGATNVQRWTTAGVVFPVGAVFSQTVVDGAGIEVSGNGTGAGIDATGGGSSGTGVIGTGGATDGVGVEGQGQGAGAGVEGTAGATGVGVVGVGGSTSGAGVIGTATAGNSTGVAGEGAGTGPGVAGTGGATGGGGHGVVGTGGGTAGTGVHGQGAGTGEGVEGYGGPTAGNGVEGYGGAGGIGVLGTGGTGSSVGVSGIGTGSAAGITGQGGPTNGRGVTGTGAGSGAGVSGTGGTSSGTGIEGWGGAPDGVGAFVQGNGTGEAIHISAGHAKFVGSNPASSTGFANTQTPKNIIKAWAQIVSDAAGGFSVEDGFNIASVSAVSSSHVTVTLVTAMSSAQYLVSVTPEFGAAGVSVPYVHTKTSANFQVRNITTLGTSRIHVLVVGAQ